MVAKYIDEHVLRSRDTSTHPVENITWEQASEFCRRLSHKESKTLSTSDRGRMGVHLPSRYDDSLVFGEGSEHEQLSHSPGQEKAIPVALSPVGRLNPNQFGVYDMHGNVFEMCQDWYDPHFYESSPLLDPTGPGAGTGQSYAWREL